MIRAFPERLIRLSESVFLGKDGSSSPWIWALPMFDDTSPGLIPGSCSCAHAIGAGRPSSRFWNASCAKGRLMRFGGVSSLQTKYKRESGDRLRHKVGSSCSFSLLKDRIAARIQAPPRPKSAPARIRPRSWGSKQKRVTVYGRAQAFPVSTSSGRGLYSP